MWPGAQGADAGPAFNITSRSEALTCTLEHPISSINVVSRYIQSGRPFPSLT